MSRGFSIRSLSSRCYTSIVNLPVGGRFKVEAAIALLLQENSKSKPRVEKLTLMYTARPLADSTRSSRMFEKSTEKSCFRLARPMRDDVKTTFAISC